MATPVNNIIHIPRPEKTAYNPDRPLSKNTLIKHQVQHFAEADRNLPPEFQTGIDIATITTEGQAAQYIGRVTKAIHDSGGRHQQVRKAT
jgi:hypothetical protein